jgi:hypothetical protein
MARAFDELSDPPARKVELNKDPLGDSFFHEQSAFASNDEPFLPPRAAARESRIRERIKAEDLQARGIPTFRNASGGVSPITDDTGTALTGFDTRHNIAYDSQGQPKLISYGESGPPKLSDPFAAIPSPIPKPARSKVWSRRNLPLPGPGPGLTAELERKERDKSIAHESTLLGRKLTLDEHDLRTGESDMKVMKNELRTQVPILLDPKYEGADRETVLGAIDQHFDTQYASPEGTHRAGGSVATCHRKPTPDAAGNRPGESEGARSRERIFDHQERLEGLRTTVDETRSQERRTPRRSSRTRAAQEGPLDQPAVPQGTEGGGLSQLNFTRQKEWARMLGGDKAVDDMLGVVRKGDVPAPAAPAVLAATHDLKDAQAKAAAVKDSDPTLYEQYSNVAASILHG